MVASAAPVRRTSCARPHPPSGSAPGSGSRPRRCTSHRSARPLRDRTPPTVGDHLHVGRRDLRRRRAPAGRGRARRSGPPRGSSGSTSSRRRAAPRSRRATPRRSATRRSATTRSECVTADPGPTTCHATIPPATRPTRAAATSASVLRDWRRNGGPAPSVEGPAGLRLGGRRGRWCDDRVLFGRTCRPSSRSSAEFRPTSGTSRISGDPRRPDPPWSGQRPRQVPGRAAGRRAGRRAGPPVAPPAGNAGTRGSGPRPDRLLRRSTAWGRGKDAGEPLLVRLLRAHVASGGPRGTAVTTARFW